MIETEVEIHPRILNPGQDEDHWVCCLKPNEALCGADVTDSNFQDFEEATCVVCEDLAGQGNPLYCFYDQTKRCPEDEDLPDWVIFDEITD